MFRSPFTTKSSQDSERKNLRKRQLHLHEAILFIHSNAAEYFLQVKVCCNVQTTQKHSAIIEKESFIFRTKRYGKCVEVSFQLICYFQRRFG